MTQVLIDTKVLEQVIAAMGCVGADSVCEASHHAKKDEHDGLRPCPVAERWHKAFDELRAARPMPAESKDAERYRWLREQHWSTDTIAVVLNPKQAVKLGYVCPYDSLLDETIDAARAKGAK